MAKFYVITDKFELVDINESIFSVAYTLSDCTSKWAGTAESKTYIGNKFSDTIIAGEGKNFGGQTFSVTMGGVDIGADPGVVSWNEGSTEMYINIESLTGDVSITATAGSIE